MQNQNPQRFLFLGGGSAATGIAELISQAMALEGMDISEARGRNGLFNTGGLVVTSRSDLRDFQKPFAQDRFPVSSFVDAIKTLKPTGIIGVSTIPKLFNRQVIETMAEINKRPIIFPYSNPTSRSECTAAEAYNWSDGRARPRKQCLYLSSHGHGGIRDRGDTCDSGDVHRGGQSSGGAGDGGES